MTQPTIKEQDSAYDALKLALGEGVSTLSDPEQREDIADAAINVIVKEGWSPRPVTVSQEHVAHAVEGIITADRDQIASLFDARAEHYDKEAARYYTPSEPRSRMLSRAQACRDVAAIIRTGEGEVPL